jgi:hypothetical protein
MTYKIKRKFRIHYTAFKGTKYAQKSAYEPVIEARNVYSAIKKAKKGISVIHKEDKFKIKINPSDITKIEEV